MVFIHCRHPFNLQIIFYHIWNKQSQAIFGGIRQKSGRFVDEIAGWFAEFEADFWAKNEGVVI